jgi:DNA phosphorothioation-dependent restriction protein DptG
MDDKLLEDAIADAKAVRATALNNAQQALNQAFSSVGVGTSVNKGYFVTGTSEPGVNRYTYDITKNGDENALEDIEKGGLIILDENEEERWIDVIRPDDMVNNIKEGVKPEYRNAQEDFNPINDENVNDTFSNMVKNDKNKSLWEKLFGL